MRKITKTIALLLAVAGITAACSPQSSDSGLTADEQLKQRVEAALIANATDLPQGIQVEASAGNVRLAGSLDCEECGGLRTPGSFDTIQQSIGAIVRAIPGVENVEFALVIP